MLADIKSTNMLITASGRVVTKLLNDSRMSKVAYRNKVFPKMLLNKR